MSGANDDLKAKMREALDKKNKKEKGVHEDGPVPREGARLRGARRRAEDAPPQGRWRGRLTGSPECVHAVRTQLRGVRGRCDLQALARQDGHRVRRPPVLPAHDEPPPAAPRRALRRGDDAVRQERRGGQLRLLDPARHVGPRHLRQGDRQPRDRVAAPRRADLPRRHAVRRDERPRQVGVEVQGRPRRRTRRDHRLQPGRQGRLHLPPQGDGAEGQLPRGARRRAARPPGPAARQELARAADSPQDG